jgi:hypothetical protein
MSAATMTVALRFWIAGESSSVEQDDSEYGRLLHEEIEGHDFDPPRGPTSRA